MENLEKQRTALSLMPELLEWQQRDSLIGQACSIHVRWAYSALAELQREFKVPYLSSVRSLPVGQQQQLLLSPAFFKCLWNSSEASRRDELAGFISTEQRRADLPVLTTPSTWSARGDFMASQQYDEGHDGQIVRPPIRALGQIAVDFGSPHALDHYPAEFGLVAAAIGVERTAFTKIDGALSAMKSISSSAYKNWVSHTQVVAFVSTPAEPSRTIAMSTCELIGRVCLLNIESAEWTTEKLLNSLVHESIHGLLYKIELAEPLYIVRRDAWRLKLVSPWSGRTLYLHSFVHACFVWFGLFKFWQLASRSDLAWQCYLDKAQSGFLRQNPLDNLSEEARRCVQPDVLRMIESMTNNVVSGSQVDAMKTSA